MSVTNYHIQLESDHMPSSFGRHSIARAVREHVAGYPGFDSVYVEDPIVSVNEVKDPTLSTMSQGVAEKETDRYLSLLKILIRTLKNATVVDRLVYLFTGQIPLTKFQKLCRDSGFIVQTYDSWVK